MGTLCWRCSGVHSSAANELFPHLTACPPHPRGARPAPSPRPFPSFLLVLARLERERARAACVVAAARGIRRSAIPHVYIDWKATSEVDRDVESLKMIENIHAWRIPHTVLFVQPPALMRPSPTRGLRALLVGNASYRWLRGPSVALADQLRGMLEALDRCSYLTAERLRRRARESGH
jgi:hypothetical protein